MDQLINTIAQLAVSALIVIVVIAIASAMRGIADAAIAWFSSRISASDQMLIEHLIDIVVRSAEAERLRAELEGVAYGALDKAVEMAAASLARYKITLDQKELRGAILAALHRLRQWTLQTSWEKPDDELMGERALPTETPIAARAVRKQWWL